MQAGLGLNGQGRGGESLAGSPQQHRGVGSLHPAVPSETLPRVPSETATTVPSKINLCLKSHT